VQQSFDLDPKLIDVDRHSDLRGHLSVLERDRVGCPIERVFVIMDVPRGATRGGHAHAKSTEIIWCVKGQLSVTTKSQGRELTYPLNQGSQALLVPPGAWVSLHDFSADAVVTVLASRSYDATEHIASVPDCQMAQDSAILMPALSSNS
jgi:dTDP-4-dehydrorhamnose 3,5-epimerase-like enzyme